MPVTSKCLKVDLLVRSWVEIYGIENRNTIGNASTSLWGRELKYKNRDKYAYLYGSTSLWGRELKCFAVVVNPIIGVVDLLVRSWVEIFHLICNHAFFLVDLLVRSWVEIPTSASTTIQQARRPPCEVVSWNIVLMHRACIRLVDLLVRSWVEILDCSMNHPEWHVDLLVRSWVEILNPIERYQLEWSTSLWGRELK